MRQAGKLTGASINVPSDLQFPTVPNFAKNHTPSLNEPFRWVTRAQALGMSSGTVVRRAAA
jgi:hypothetical protein